MRGTNRSVAVAGRDLADPDRAANAAPSLLSRGETARRNDGSVHWLNSRNLKTFVIDFEIYILPCLNARVPLR